MSGAVLSPTLSPLLSRFPAPYLRNNKIAKKVIVLGMDGLDPTLLNRFMEEGQLPTFKQFLSRGSFGKLRTTMPAQSPVAWSSFLTGTNPGGNGIYDFIHRDPKTFTPYLSTSKSHEAGRTLDVGKWKIPLSSGGIDSMRKGPAFYRVLEEHSVDSTLFQIPANFPTTTESTKAVSGMGTPDLLGGYGTFTYFSELPVAGSEKFSSGNVVRIFPLNHSAKTALSGPKNSFREDGEVSKVDLTIQRDPVEQIVRIRIQSHDIVLKKGEWSEWTPLSFSFVPMFATVGGMVRFYVKDVHPYIKIYCSPINIDPMEPTMPICSPSSYSREVSEAVGRFYTQGLPADTKALSHGVLSDEEYFSQAKLVIEESLRNFEYTYDKFKEGFYFFYFSSIDQNSHMLWRLMDPTHPLYKADASAELKDAVRYFYRKMDSALRLALTKVDENSLFLVLSDHGFLPFRREFHLSTWLVENGYTVLREQNRKDEGDFFNYVDWEKSKAYALGINGIYLNLNGRETHGSLDPNQASAVKAEILAKLPQVVDPLNGNQVIHAAYDSLQIYSGPFVPLAPDILVGYAPGYRISDEAVLGKFPKDIVGDRTDPWAADHCIDANFVPGVLLSNKQWSATQPAIWDMAPTILEAFGLSAPQEMEGRSIFA